MTEEQLKSIPVFSLLPIFDEWDERAETLMLPATRVKQVRECTTMDEVLRCLKDSQLVPLGGLRARGDGGPIVVVYFAEKG